MAVEMSGLSHVYMPGTIFEKKALDNISVTIRDGEFLGIIGHTGSGKSTLVQHLNGLLRPTAGQVVVNGHDTRDKNLRVLRQEVGLVFQYPEHQLFEETVRKDIAFGLQRAGLSPGDTEARILDALEKVGLPETVLEKSPFELSGGQKRRVAIAGVLVMQPAMLVLDEPTAGLDPKGRDDIFGLLRRLHDQGGTTVIVVSHSMEDMARVADRLLVMAGGQVAMDGSPSEVFEKWKELDKIGLSAPQITRLFKQLGERFPGLDTRILTAGQAVDALEAWRHREVKA